MKESITLYYREGAADKVYSASVDTDGPTSTATFAWGRRGSTPTVKVVTGPPALGAYKSKVAEKLAKGYKEGEAATELVVAPIPPSAHKPETPRPILLREIDQDQLLKLCEDPDWYAQEKHDGERKLVRWHADRAALVGFSRTGKETIAMPKPVVDAFKRAFGQGTDDLVIDGELVSDEFFVFDVLSIGEIDLTVLPYSARLKALETMFAHSTDGVLVVGTARTATAKLAMVRTLMATAREGVVLRLASAPYTAGRPNSGGPALKFKFVKSASVIVATAPAEHRSVRVKMICGTNIGSVSVPVNHKVPRIGAVIEVRYLNIRPGGHLYQPVLLGVREDIPPADCTMSQLKYKNEGVEAGEA